jgi:hypothetical protein
MQLPPPESRPRTKLTVDEFNALWDRLSQEQMEQLVALGNNHDEDGMERLAATFYTQLGGAAAAEAVAAAPAAPAVAAPAVAAAVPAAVQPPAPAPVQQPLASFITPIVGGTPSHGALMALRDALEEHKRQAVHAQSLIAIMVDAQRSIDTASRHLGGYGGHVHAQCVVLQAAMLPPGGSGRMGFGLTAQMQWCDSITDLYNSMIEWVDERLVQLIL